MLSSYFDSIFLVSLKFKTKSNQNKPCIFNITLQYHHHGLKVIEDTTPNSYCRLLHYPLSYLFSLLFSLLLHSSRFYIINKITFFATLQNIYISHVNNISFFPSIFSYTFNQFVCLNLINICNWRKYYTTIEMRIVEMLEKKEMYIMDVKRHLLSSIGMM